MTEPLSTILSAGELIAGRYRMVAAIAQGGMGSVWKALDERAFNQAVAVKVIRSKNVSDTVKARFIDEAKVISKLNSPHIVGLREFGETEAGYPFFVMDLLEGQTVTERLATGGPCSERDGALIIDGVLAGLQEIHLQGVVHRDLKPSNVFLEQSSAIDAHVRILDLGIAQLVEGGRKGDKSRAKRVIGTPRWMAPEVLLGEAASPVSDIYSVGLLGILVLGGEIPHSKFGRDGTVQPFDRACIIQRLGSNSVKVTGRRGMEPVSDAFCHVLEDALWRDSADRYQDALEFRIALREALPHLGMPTLPFAQTSAYARPLSVAPEHTVLDDGALLGDDETNLSVDFDPEAFEGSVQNNRKEPLSSNDSQAPGGHDHSESSVDVLSSSKPISAQALMPDESSESLPHESGTQSKGRIAAIAGLCLAAGIGIAWFVRGDGPTSEGKLNASSLGFDASMSVSRKASSGGDALVPSAVIVEKKPNDSGVDVDSTKPTDDKLVATEKKVVQRPVLKPGDRVADVKVKKGRKNLRSKGEKAGNPKEGLVTKITKPPRNSGVESLGRRCRTQFKEIVRDSEGGSLVQDSALCGRVRKLVTEATKPKCALSAAQRKELTMLEVLCSESP